MEAPIEQRRARAADAWNLDSEIVLIAAGKPIHIPGGADQTFPYKTHPQYRWLTDRHRPGGVLAYDSREGWILFEPPVTEQELVWGADQPAIGRPIDELAGWLSEREGRPVAGLGSPLDLATDAELSAKLGPLLDHARRPKDAYEVDLLRHSAAATAAGYAALKAALRPGVSERALQIEFEAATLRAGATGMGYASIVGSGPNTAVFHFVPGARVVQPGEMVLVDAGGEYEGYVTDVTRTYLADGQFTANQQWHYDAVLRAEQRAIEACTVGAEWPDVHRIAAHSLAESMIEAGLLRCSADEATDSGVMALFFPHGVGHMVGLGVRDASGPLPGRDRVIMAGGLRARMDIPLEAGYLVTIEPGLYFIPALLNKESNREKFREQIDWAALEPWIGEGSGVRIEDNILVTEQGPDNLTTAIPK